MRSFFISLLIILLIDLSMQRCASVASPNGGPRDTIPPSLIESYPANGTTSFKEQEFKLTFSEFVKADKIQQQLIITPRTENKYKTTAKKNSIILKFTDPFEDSTTYNFNFADGITDITENNPAVNLSLAFSTGAYIDSLSIEGNVIDLFKQENAKGYTVGLYPITDSLDFFKEKPVYFTTTSDSGQFQLSYLKSGLYKLLVFNDDNRNITFDPETEQHGFIPDTVQLDSTIVLDQSISTLLQNVKPITFINSRPTGPYVELKYSKQIDDYTIAPDFLQHSLTGESKEVIRIYKTEEIPVGDSLTIYATALDSLGNQTEDTIKTAFITSNRKPSKFSLSVDSKGDYLTDNYSLQVRFSKPIQLIDTSQLFIERDSTFEWQLNPTFTWNENRTQLDIQSNLNRKELIDTLLLSIPPDTSQMLLDTSQAQTEPATPEITAPTEEDLTAIQFVLNDGAFISIESDTSARESFYIPYKESTAFGTVKLSMLTNYQSYIVQLVDNNNIARYSARNNDLVNFPRVTPGTYSIRVLIDNNQDGKWSAGNLLLDIPPEDIYLHEEETSVRENWVLEIDISF